jgi:predicted nucleotidyltransferase
VEKTSSPPLLPIFRSRQQVELLALILGHPKAETSITDLSARLGIPFASAHREVERAERAGVLTSRKIGNTRLVRADTSSPYFDGLSAVLVRAFGVPAVLGRAMSELSHIDQAFVFGSWASRYLGEEAERPVHDIDLLVLGEPDRNALYERIEKASKELGREVQVTIRDTDWITNGTGSFHDTVVSRPRVPIVIPQPSRN